MRGTKNRRVLVWLALTAALTLAVSPDAQASATGAAGFRILNVSGVYTVHINGSGTYVNYVSGTWRTNGGEVCNVRVTAEFFDTAWRWYETKSAYHGLGCSTGGTQRINIYARKRPGYMCSTMRAEIPTLAGIRRMTSVCHRIA